MNPVKPVTVIGAVYMKIKKNQKHWHPKTQIYYNQRSVLFTLGKIVKFMYDGTKVRDYDEVSFYKKCKFCWLIMHHELDGDRIGSCFRKKKGIYKNNSEFTEQRRQVIKQWNDMVRYVKSKLGDYYDELMKLLHGINNVTILPINENLRDKVIKLRKKEIEEIGSRLKTNERLRGKSFT